MSEHRHQLESLLIDELIDGLNEPATRELESMLLQDAGIDRHAFERTAAALFLAANTASTESMPSALGERLLADAKTLLDEGE